MSDYFTSLLQAVAGSRNLNIQYSKAFVTDNIPPISLAPCVIPGLKTYCVSITVGQSVFNGYGFISCLARSTAEQTAYMTLCASSKAVRRIQRTLEQVYKHRYGSSLFMESPICKGCVIDDSSLLEENLSQYSDEFSQVLNEPILSTKEKESTDEFQLYALSDSESDEEFTSVPVCGCERRRPCFSSITNQQPCNKIEYTVPKTMDEIISAFTKDSVSGDGDLDPSFYNGCDQFEFVSNVEKSLIRMAADRGLEVTFDSSYHYKLRLYSCTAIAGPYRAVYTSIRKRIARKMAANKLLDIMYTVQPVQRQPEPNTTMLFIDTREDESLDSFNELSQVPTHYSHFTDSAHLGDSTHFNDSTQFNDHIQHDSTQFNNATQFDDSTQLSDFSQFNDSTQFNDSIHFNTYESSIREDGLYDYNCAQSQSEVQCNSSPYQADDNLVQLSPTSLHTQIENPEDLSVYESPSTPPSSGDIDGDIPQSLQKTPPESPPPVDANDTGYMSLYSNPVDVLQAITIERRLPFPKYSFASHTYNGEDTGFMCTVTVTDEFTAQGYAFSEMEARTMAACNCIDILECNGLGLTDDGLLKVDNGLGYLELNPLDNGSGKAVGIMADQQGSV